MKRRFAAILIADSVGYSRLLGQDAFLRLVRSGPIDLTRLIAFNSRMRWIGTTLQLIAAGWTLKRTIGLIPVVLLAIWAIAEVLSRY